MGPFRRTAGCLLASASLALLAGPLGCAETARPVMGSRQQQRVPGEYLVTARSGTDERRIRDLYAEYSVVDLRRVRDDVFLLKLAKDPGLDTVRTVGLSSGEITAVQPNYVYRP